MKYRIREFIRRAAHRLGLDVSRYVATARALNANGITVVFDIGANQGQFGAELRRDGYTGRIISFEPISGAYARLLQRSRGDSAWVVHERCAVGAEAKTVTINLSRNSGSSSVLPIMDEHTRTAPDSAYIGQERVQQIRFDSILARYLSVGDRYFMKIDTQGYEKAVMDGASEALKKVTGLQLEVSFFDLYEGQESYRYFLDWAEANGFILWSIQAGFSNSMLGKTLQADVCFFRK